MPAIPSAPARLVTAASSHVGLLFGVLAVAQLWLLNATAEGSQPLLSILVRVTKSSNWILHVPHKHVAREGITMEWQRAAPQQLGYDCTVSCR